MLSGLITRVWILFPQGCNALAHAAIFLGETQIYPTNPDFDYSSDTFPIEFEDNYGFAAPEVISLRTYNLDDTYDHTIYVHLTTVESPVRQVVSIARKAPRGLVAEIIKALQDIEKDLEKPVLRI